MVFHQPQNSIGHNNCNFKLYENEGWKPHFHKNFELVYVLDGQLQCTVNAKPALLEKGGFALCLPYEVHAYTCMGRARYWVGVFSADFVHAFAKQVAHKTGNRPDFRCSPSTEAFFLENLVHNPTPPHLVIKAVLYAVCQHYLDAVSLTDTAPSRQDNLAKIVDYVSANYMQELTLAHISDLLRYDYHYVSRYFHTVFRMSFKQFVNQYRLEQAIRLLEESNKKIAAIALESGFQSIRSFNNCFRQQYDMSPSAYRRQRFARHTPQAEGTPAPLP